VRYTRLGHTGLTVSRIALGCMSYGNPKWRTWVLDERDAVPFYKAALDGGINFFDTADMYSLGLSEEVTGRALRSMSNLEELVIATKVHFPMNDRANMGGLSRKHIVQACEASLKRLGVGAIDLYQIHRFDANTPIDETLAALDHLVHAGKVRYLGASSGWAWQLMRALSISERNGWARFASMQNHYNLLNREEEREMIPLCLAEGLGVVPWSPLARGVLARPRSATEHRDSTRSANDPFAQRLYGEAPDWGIVDAVERVAKARGVTMAEVATAWLLSKPGVTAPIIGATKLLHLEAAIRAVDIELDPSEIASLEAPYTPKAPAF
jgi:aryl-alcohol dehydrogenase-like predicted oxidoreductase